MLDAKVAEFVGKGYAVESRTDSQAVLTKKKRIGWLLNILLTVITGGLWLIVVFFQLVNRKADRVVLTATEDGRVVRA